MNRQEISDFFARRDAVWQQHDADALAADHTEDGLVESPFRGNVYGRSTIHDVYAQWFASFPDARYSTEHLLIDGDSVVQFINPTTDKAIFLLDTLPNNQLGFTPIGEPVLGWPEVKLDRCTG